jgi:hypothetical protein
LREQCKHSATRRGRREETVATDEEDSMLEERAAKSDSYGNAFWVPELSIVF